MPTVFKIYWALHNSALVTSFLVTIIYWTFLHFSKLCIQINLNEIQSKIFLNCFFFPAMKLPLNAMNILSHACNSVVMFLDILIVASPMRLLHVIQPLAFTGIYGLFSIVYFLAGGKSLYVWNWQSIDEIILFKSLLIQFFRGGQSYIYPILDWAYPGEAIVVVIGLALLEVAVHMVLFWIYKLRVFLHRRYFGIELILTTKSTKIHENNSYTGTNNGFKATANIIAWKVFIFLCVFVFIICRYDGVP